MRLTSALATINALDPRALAPVRPACAPPRAGRPLGRSPLARPTAAPRSRGASRLPRRTQASDFGWGVIDFLSELGF